MQKIGLIYTTLSSQEEAENLAEHCIAAKLAACVNIVTSGLSIYEWEGKIEKKSEYYLIFKTSIEKLTALYDWVLKNHSYSVPAILKMIVETSVEFENYVVKQTSR